MKILYVLLTLCFALTAQAKVLVEQFTIDSDWPVDYMLESGELTCPGGTLGINMGMPYCEGGNAGMHMRGTEIYSCLGNSFPFDPRVEGTVWIQINDNFDADYTGPGWGTWKVVPGESCDKDSLINPNVYWEGTWTGFREIVSDDPITTWVHDIKLVGHGVGGNLEGLKIYGTEVITLFTPMAVPYELLPFPVSGPESIVQVEIRSKVEK
jgi:hypothetical protein